MKHKAVILGNNYYIGLSTIRCLGIEGVHTVAVDYSEEDRYGAASKYCSEKVIVPHYKKEPNAFIQALIEYAKNQEEKPVLIPCHDSYLEAIDAHLDQLKEYYLLPQTQQGLATQVINKDTLHALALEKGIKVPESVSIDDENLREIVNEKIHFPCLVKPVDSPSFMRVFRTKIFKVYNMNELDEAVLKAKEANLDVFIQRIIPGFDDHMYTFDAYLNQDSKVTHWTTAQKLRQYPINFGASVYTIQRYVPELYEVGSKFLEAIQYKGFGEIEFKKDAETGDFYLIEINARITNFNHLLYKVGLNFPYITYRELIGDPLPPKAIKATTNRAFWYAYEDILAVKGYLKTKQLSFGQVFKSFFRPKAYAIWSWKDPKPLLVFLKSRIGKLSRFKQGGRDHAS
ncbi:carboxylate--amine ligase [Ornithinibacillus halophilus]|uniref:Predicted ATP-dependent carboligase, ATP-grasp superfamily n=1 Tax=Ornithinibacillus halophilus TaxID=930117 RepID=A0A1M5GBA9_9BACI|nr:carboxylate--amine ligase [Ornithinibacillus halophilus]SHG01090.1 Predicted ATP-dependent carboligase, ATP-grasp superfamily [Ornithinibacillus halophilus]